MVLKDPNKNIISRKTQITVKQNYQYMNHLQSYILIIMTHGTDTSFAMKKYTLELATHEII